MRTTLHILLNDPVGAPALRNWPLWKAFVFVLFRFVLAFFILQLWATVGSQIAIGVSGPETGGWSPFLLGDSHTWCQNTLRHYILSQMVTLPPALALLRQSLICVPVAGPNLLSTFCALHGANVTINRSLGAGFDLRVRHLCLLRRTLPIQRWIWGFLSSAWTSSQAAYAVTDTCVMLSSERGQICGVFKNTPATSSLCSQVIRNWF